MKTGILWLVISSLMILTLIIASCGKATPVTTATTTTKTTSTTTIPTTPTIQTGGTLRIIHNGSAVVNPGNPPRVSVIWDNVLGAPAIETLLRIDKEGNQINYLVESWNVAQDLKSFTFKVRAGVKFHDGTDFNVEAVKYNLDRYLASTRPDLKPVTSVEIIDNNTGRLNLAQYDSYVPHAIATMAAGLMVSPTVLKEKGEDWAGANPTGTGPFKFISWQRDVSMKFEKFDGYWQKGKPYLDGIQVTFVSDPMVATASLRAGDGDLLITQQVKEASDLVATGKFVVTKATGAVSTIGISVSPADSPLAKLKVRQAMAYAIDNDAIAKTLGYGLISPARQMAVPGMWSYNPDVKGYPYNPQKAKELLAEAGYPNGFKTKLQPMISGPLVPMWTAVQGYFKAVGIEGELDPWTSTKWNQATAQGWEGSTHATLSINEGSDPTGSMLARFSKNSVFKSILYVPAIEEKLQRAVAEPDSKKRQALVWEVQKMIIDDYAIIVPVWYQPNLTVKYPNVKDTTILAPWGRTWQPENAWLSK